MIRWLFTFLFFYMVFRLAARMFLKAGLGGRMGRGGMGGGGGTGSAHGTGGFGAGEGSGSNSAGAGGRAGARAGGRRRLDLNRIEEADFEEIQSTTPKDERA